MTRHTHIRSRLTAGAALLLALALLSTYGTPAQAQAGTSTFDTVAQLSATCAGGPSLSNTTITEDGNGEVSLRATFLLSAFRFS